MGGHKQALRSVEARYLQHSFGSLQNSWWERYQHLEVLKALPFTMIYLPLPFWVLHAVPPSPDAKFRHGCPGYLNCILKARRMALAILYGIQANLCEASWTSGLIQPL